MKGITFGIITSENTNHYIDSVISSIEDQNIDKNLHEILIVGNCSPKMSDQMRIIPFDENIRNLWITRKKNLITEEAKFDIIVYMHDYLILDKNWYSNFLNFGDDWDLCMNSILNSDGKRSIDWIGLPDDSVYGNVILPYDYEGSDGMYIPGNFWIGKKKVMSEFPLDENFVWGEGEDIEWSKRVLGGFPPIWLKNINDFREGRAIVKKHKYVMNKLCIVRSLKDKQFPSDLFREYDLHSGNESRPLASTTENYKYLGHRK